VRAADPIYLDHAATTPVDPRVVAAMQECLGVEGTFGNPSSVLHAPGRAAARRVEEARAAVAALIGAAPEEIVFTSGATEADNLALLGLMRPNRDRGRHLVSFRTEHKAVLDPLRELEREGFEVTWLTPDRDGAIDPEAIRAALRADTLLVSVMQVNNETGVLANLAAIGRVCRERGVLLHSDAAQGVGREPIDVRALGVDLLAFSAHKLYGPKGIGALWVGPRARTWLKPIIHGGGQERGLRSGTLATHQIVGFGVACELAAAALADERERQRALRERLWEGLQPLGGVYRNGPPATTVAGILNVSIEGVEGESLLAALGGLAVASGSACTSANAEPSYVLRALGRRPALAQSSLRLSLGRGSTTAEIDQAAAVIRRAVERLRAVAPAAAWPAGCRPPRPLWSPPSSAGPAVAADPLDPLSPTVRRLFEALPGGGGFADDVGPVVSGSAGNEADGAQLRFELRIAGDTVNDARFQAWGCPHTLAVAAWLNARLPGRRRDALVPGNPESWALELGVPIEKLGRLLLIEDALQECVVRWPVAALR
jgi:cysteine desulfurase